jgi:uncharacterized protein YgiM (DUF1202 family)
MDGEYDTTSPGFAIRAFRRVVPWVALLVLLVTLAVVWSGFQASLQRVASTLPGNGSVVATPSAAASATSVPTATVAVTRVAGVKLRSAPIAGAKVLMTVKKGAKLAVLERTDTWLRVKEPDGLIGWTENLVKNVDIRTK